MNAIRSVCIGANADNNMLTVTNSRLPPNITALIIIGYTKLNPDTFIYIPYAIPRNRKPARIGIVCGNAHTSALLITFFLLPSIAAKLLHL